MASDLDDQWLYGDTEVSSPKKVKEQPVVVIKENGDGTATERAQTPTLDDMELALNAPSQPAVSKIISTAPDLQPKQPAADTSELEENAVGEGETEEEEGEGGDSESDEDDVEITIGEITTAPGAYNRTPSYSRMSLGAGGAGGMGSIGKKVDVDVIPQIGGQSLLEFDLEEAAAEKPWRLPGADIADYFNYGFMEDTWKIYCDKQRKMRGEINQLNKIVVHSSGRSSISEPKFVPPITSVSTINMPPPPPNILPPGFPPPHISSIHPPPPFMPPPPPVIGHLLPELPRVDTQQTPERRSPKDGGPLPTPPPTDNASDGRATPGIEIPPPSSKPPLLPPPHIPPVPAMTHGGLPPPPFGVPPPPGFPGMPPGQDNIAAAMAAAMFGGGIRPPDNLHNVPPPHMIPNMNMNMNMHHFPPPPHGFTSGPDHGGMPPPPFPGVPPNFPMSVGDHGPMLDDRGLGLAPDILSGRLLGNFPWDPTMGPPPQELLEVFAHRNDRRGSRSRSRSSSGSRSLSRSSSFDDRPRRKRERRHKRHSRSRSRSYDRDREREHRHRSGRHHRNGDYHRVEKQERDRDRDRDRERDRDRDRERERETRRRREHREEKSRHERSNRRHRSSSRGGGRDEERSSRKEKSKTVDQELSRESRSRSKTP